MEKITVGINGRRTTFTRPAGGEWTWSCGTAAVEMAMGITAEDRTARERITALMWGLEKEIVLPETLPEISRALGRGCGMRTRQVTVSHGMGLPVALLLHRLDRRVRVAERAGGDDWQWHRAVRYSPPPGGCTIGQVSEAVTLLINAALGTTDRHDEISFMRWTDAYALGGQYRGLLFSCLNAVFAGKNDWGTPEGHALIEDLLRLRDVRFDGVGGIESGGLWGIMEGLNPPKQFVSEMLDFAMSPDSQYVNNPLSRAAILLLVSSRLIKAGEHHQAYGLLEEVYRGWGACSEYEPTRAYGQEELSAMKERREKSLDTLAQFWAGLTMKLYVRHELRKTMNSDIASLMPDSERSTRLALRGTPTQAAIVFDYADSSVIHDDAEVSGETRRVGVSRF